MINIQTRMLKKIFEFLILIFYIWYFLPIVNVSFQANIYKIAFFGCFLIGSIGLFVCNGVKKNWLIALLLIYFMVFTLMFLLDIDDIKKTIRVNFVFFGTGLLYFGVLDNEGKISLGKKILILFAVTTITSTVGVFIDNSAARTLAHAAADEELQTAYKLKNIAGIYLFQSLVYFVPILVCLPKNRKSKTICAILIILIFSILLNASFTISLIAFAIALITSLILRQRNDKRFFAFLITMISVTILFINGEPILDFLSNAIKNEKISTRLFELKNMIYAGISFGDAKLRLELYQESLSTFLNNPFGVGAFYSYKNFENGIGYHSQILDDLARFGIFALAFYIMFFVFYYKTIKHEWKKINTEEIAKLTVTIYIIFLILNIGFRSAEESVFMFIIIPVLPELIIDIKNKKLKQNTTSNCS